MPTSTEGEWHDGWRLQWHDDVDIDSDEASAVIAAFERLIRWRRRSPRLEAWKQITHMLEHYEAEADRLATMDPEQAAARRAKVERIKQAIDAGRTEGQILKLFGHEQAARAALVAHWRDRVDPDKRNEAQLRLYFITGGRRVDLEEEWRIDREHKVATDASGRRAKRAERIVNRLKR